MPKGIDWINFTYVNLGFFSQVFVMYYFSAVAEIKKNWPSPFFRFSFYKH